MNNNHKIIAGGAALLLGLGLGVSAASTTSAYYSDPIRGGGSTTFGGGVDPISIDVQGDPATAPARVTNTGSIAQDVWVQLPATPDDASKNLDHATLQIFVDGALIWNSATPRADTHGSADRIPTNIRLIQDLQPGQSVEVAFALALNPQTIADHTLANGTPVELHYNIVAVQPGIQPGA